MAEPRSTETTPNVSVLDEDTNATSYSGDIQSEAGASLIGLPSVPNNTPAGTVAGSHVPDNEYIERRFSRLYLSSSAPASVQDIQDSSDISIASHDTEDTETTLEHSNWAEHAEEIVRQGLQRLVQLAEDEKKARPEKDVKYLYSERLAKLIKQGTTEFDKTFLD